MKEGFPLLTTKKLHLKSIVGELLWFLNGQTNIKWLVDNGISIWNGDAWKNYQLTASKEDFLKDGVLRYEEFIDKIKIDDDFAKKWGSLGNIYGAAWRNWRGKDGMIGEKDENGTRIITWNQIDQIANLINDLKTNPDSRRLLVTAWNPAELDTVVLPPCHYGFQFYTRELSIEERVIIFNQKKEKGEIIVPEFNSVGEINAWTSKLLDNDIPTRAISLIFNMRSCDVPLGLPFNIASYGLLLEIIAKEVNMVPDELIGNLGDCHIYLNQIEGVKEHIGRPLTDAERYNIWFTNNYETGFENNGILPNFDDPYWEYTPSRTREPFTLPKLVINDEFWNHDANLLSNLPHIKISDFYVENYKSHPTIKMPLSN
jgi:thymidylate synthase